MELLTTLLLVAGAGYILFWTLKNIKRHPQAFSAQNTSRSFFTVGILALILIAFIAILVLLLRH